MNTIIIILLVVGAIIALMLIIAVLMKREHYVNREIIINAPRQKVFSFLRHLKNQDQFNKWARADKNRKEETRGTDGTVGFVYSWSGDKSAGKGEKEIMNIVEEERIETEIRFEKPMRMSARVIMETASVSDNQTKVNLINTGTLKYPLNIMIPMAEKRFAKDMDSSLSTLKTLLEK